MDEATNCQTLAAIALLNPVGREEHFSESATSRLQIIPSQVTTTILKRTAEIGSFPEPGRVASGSRRVKLAFAIVAFAFASGGGIAIGRNALPEHWTSATRSMDCGIDANSATLVAQEEISESETLEYWLARDRQHVVDIVNLRRTATSPSMQFSEGSGSASCDPSGRGIADPEIGYFALTPDVGPTVMAFYGWIPAAATTAAVEFGDGTTVDLTPDTRGYIFHVVKKEFRSTPQMTRQILRGDDGQTILVRDITDQTNNNWRTNTP